MPNVSLSEESGGVNVMLRNRGGIGWKAGGAEKGQPQGARTQPDKTVGSVSH